MQEWAPHTPLHLPSPGTAPQAMPLSLPGTVPHAHKVLPRVGRLMVRDTFSL